MKSDEIFIHTTDLNIMLVTQQVQWNILQACQDLEMEKLQNKISLKMILTGYNQTFNIQLR